MIHPSEANLALYAGGELSLWRRLRMRRHLSGCQDCRGIVESFAFARERLRGIADEMPPGVSWSRRAVEMRANIRVGLAAGECVGPAIPEPRIRWRTAVTVVPVTLLLVAAWLLQWSQPTMTDRADELVLEATPEGIHLRHGDSVLSLQNPDSNNVTYTVNAQGTLRARWVDAETGYVTINHVYAQ